MIVADTSVWVDHLRAGDPLGDSGRTTPVSIRVELDGQKASIAVDGQVVAQTRGGLAVAEIGSGLYRKVASAGALHVPDCLRLAADTRKRRSQAAAGISAGIDMSLHLVARLAGMALAERTARQMDFSWTRA